VLRVQKLAPLPLSLTARHNREVQRLSIRKISNDGWRCVAQVLIAFALI
jgi:hypothetical protein